MTSRDYRTLRSAAATALCFIAIVAGLALILQGGGQ